MIGTMTKKDYNKKYYEEHKEKMKNYYKEKVECEVCGAVYTRSNKTNHTKTRKHLRNITDDREKIKILMDQLEKLQLNNN